LKIGNISTQLGTELDSEIDETHGMSSRAGYATRMGALNALGPPMQDPH